jgi:UDP-glucose 4-epimerase
MDFISVQDVAKANILAAESPIFDDVFNVASGVETSLNDLVSGLLKVMGSSLKPEYVGERKVNPVSRRLADTRKARQLLGFSAEVPLLEGLMRLVLWWREQNASQRPVSINE